MAAPPHAEPRCLGTASGHRLPGEEGRTLDMAAERSSMAIRRLAESLNPHGRSKGARVFRTAHHLVLLLGLAAVLELTLESLPLPRPLLLAVAVLAAAFFLAEWLLRLLAAPWTSQPPGRPGARLHYLVSFLGLVDLACGAALPLALLLGAPTQQAAAAGMLWSLKLTRYGSGFALIGRVLRNERSALLGVLAAFAIVLLLAGTAEYLLEGEAQSGTFDSLPAAIWWCIVTLTTTGYGDAVPQSALGRVVAGLVMVLGIAIFALWAGILASGFAAEVRRRDFLQTWDLVAKVPLFGELGAGVIAEVTRLLRPRRLPAGAALMRRGDTGDCMYFIVEGEVEVALAPHPVRLGPGAFLGEMALITGEPRSATVSALRETQVLTLDIADFRALAGQHPALTQAIEAEAARRRGVVG